MRCFRLKIQLELLIPLALEKIPAGFPSPAEPYIAEYIDFNKYLISNPAATFLLGAAVNQCLMLVSIKTTYWLSTVQSLQAPRYCHG